MIASSHTLPIVAVTFFLAGIVKGVTGMGLPTVAMGVLGTIMPTVTAASLLIVPSFVTNVWQMLSGPSFYAVVSRLWTMALGIAIGTLVSAWFLTTANPKWTSVALGATLTLYAASGLLLKLPTSIPPHVERWMSPVAGLTSGVVTGGTGIFVIPAVPYIQALGLNKDDLIQALGLSFTVSTVALAAALSQGGAFKLGNMVASAFAVVPALLGMWLGQVIRRRISPATFRRWCLILLGVLGVELTMRPFF